MIVVLATAFVVFCCLAAEERHGWKRGAWLLVAIASSVIAIANFVKAAP